MFNITKIKRILAYIGIGNPLNQLIYTSYEIEKMKSHGEIVGFFREGTRSIGRPVGSKDSYIRNRRFKVKPQYAIKCGKLVISKRFDTFEDAYKWVEWNYKGNLSKVDIVSVTY